MLDIARSHTLSNSLQRARPNKWKKNKAPPNSPEMGCEQPTHLNKNTGFGVSL